VALFQLVVVAVCAWLHREQTDLIAFLREENRVLKSRLGGRRLRFDDGERRRLGELGHRLGRRRLTQVTTVVTPDTILRWHRELIARKWTYRGSRPSRCGLQAHIRTLIVRMAAENPTWGYTRIQGALKNVGHRVGRSTIARVLRVHGIPPGGQRARPWRTFVQAHWPALVAADFFTTEVWTARGLVTYYTAFLIELQSRRVQVLGSTPYPERSLRHPVPAVRQWRVGRPPTEREDPRLRSRSEVEQSGGAVALYGRRSCTPNAAGRAELQRACGTVCPLGERGMPGPDRPARRVAPTEDPARIRHVLPSRAKSPGTRERADRTPS